jgi:hypothetical protein
MAINIKSKEVDRLARELVVLCKGSSITQAVEYALSEQIAREKAEIAKRLEVRRNALAEILESIRKDDSPDLDPRPLKGIRDELWGGL